MARKKTITLFETLPLETPVSDEKITVYEDYSIVIEPPKGYQHHLRQ